MASTQRQQSQSGTTPSNGQHPIAQQLAVIQAQKQPALPAQKITFAPQHKGNTWATRIGFSDKKLWDWLGLLIVPTILAIAAIWFSVSQSEQQNATNIQLSRLSNQQTLQQASDQQQEATFQAYLDRMTDLIENGKLADPHSSAAIRALATSQTLTALRRLDGKRRGYLILFLHDAKLITTFDPIVSLNGASVGNANLSGADLSNANLNGTDLSNANLNGTDLSYDSLFNTNLNHANLNHAILFNITLFSTNLNHANLIDANLIDAHLSYDSLFGTNLSNANLGGADLSGADLSIANLSGADLSIANLSNANLSRTHLFGVNLFEANLKGAHIDKRQLAQAKSLQYAIMPDGSRHP